MSRFHIKFPAMRLRDELDRLMTDACDSVSDWAPFGAFGQRVFPALNVWEDEKHLYVEAELPGLKLEDLEISVQGDELTIKGERKDVESEEVSFHRRERGIGQFSRVIDLPVSVDADKVSACLRDGVLTVTLPKAQEVLPRKIAVKG